MKLSELIAFIGDENVLVEPITSSIVGNVTLKKNGDTLISVITRGMKPEDVLTGRGNIGLLVWLPRDLFEIATKPK